MTAIDWLLAGVGACWLLMFGIQTTRRSPFHHAPRRLHHLREDAIFWVVLAYLLTALALDAITRRWIPDATDARFRAIVGSGSQFAGTIACALVMSRRFAGGFSSFLFGSVGAGATRKVVVALGATLVGIGVCPLMAAGTAWVLRFVAPTMIPESHPTLQALHDSALPVRVAVGFWIGAAVIAPLAEEFFFRGMLQNALGSILTSRWAPILLSSLAFGAVHFTQPHTVPALVVLGLILGYAYERTGAIVVPVIAHSLFNLKTLCWDALGAGAVT